MNKGTVEPISAGWSRKCCDGGGTGIVGAGVGGAANLRHRRSQAMLCQGGSPHTESEKIGKS